MNLAIQGVDVLPKDIDILAYTKEDALKIEECLKEYVTEPVKYKESEIFKSFFGKFKIGGVEIEVMTDLENKIPDKNLWIEINRLSDKKTIMYEGLEINVISLQQVHDAYLRMGRFERAELVEKYLDKNN